MTLIKTSILTAIATVIKVITRFIINKLVAVYIGPSGLAIVGQLQNFVSITMTVASGGINSGVVKYVAEFKDEERKTKLLSSALFITLISSIIVGLFLILFSSYLSNELLHVEKYAHIFVVFGFTIILFSLNAFMMSILNGEKEIKKYILVNISGSIISLIFTSLLVVLFRLEGALLAMVLNQSILFFITLRLVVKSFWFKKTLFAYGINKQDVIRLSKYAFMALVSAISVPLVQIFIRDYIGEHIGWDEAGYWQGINYISNMYLMVVTTSLGIYYLPRLSEILDNTELKREIFNGYKIIMPIVIVLALGIFLFKDLVIQIAFSQKFTPMQELFKWQLIGDVIKVASWLLSYLMLAKAMTRVFVITEVLFGASFALFSVLFINRYELVGVTYAFALNYVVYLIVMGMIFRKVFR